MPETKMRVHNLAKELSVSSKAIIEKCAAEGIEIKNHMHVLSAGLEATIREWFSTGSHATTIEEAGRVDLEKVRVKRAPRKGAKATKAVPPVEAPVAVEAVAEAPAAIPAAPPIAPDAAPPPPVAAPPPPPIIVEEPPPTVVPAPPAPTPATLRPAAEAPAIAPPPAVVGPPVPERVVAAGPKNIPAPAQLQGPRVVRIEAPDYVERPRPATRGPSTGSGFGPPPPPSTAPARRKTGKAAEPEEDDDSEAARDRRRRGTPAAGPGRHRANPRRSTTDAPAVIGELLREWRDRDLIERRERLDHASGRGITGLRADESRTSQRGATPRPVARPQKVELTEPVIVKEFCSATGLAFAAVFRKLQELGVVATLNEAIETDTAQLIAMEHGIELEITRPKTALDRLREAFDARERKKSRPRPPVVTVLGHVDHGKTSLLDRIRKTRVAADEAGGITQHIGAYRVRIDDRHVTFLDTPGHEAFTAMRARGAQMTDVVVLVVAADDGVMPQTVEAINHARAAKVPIVVALNKIDLPQADANKVYGQLAEQQLVPQEWGGDTDVIKTSAITGEGIDELLSHLAALSELLDLKADPTVPATGTVIEAQRDERQGCVARLLVQEGTLKAGCVVVCGAAHGRVRAMRDDAGRPIREAGPATPVEVLGLDAVPDAGDRFYVVDTLAEAKRIADEVAIERRAASLIRVVKPTTLESLLADRAAGGEVPELNVIVKADVQGSVDVLRKTLSDIPTTEVKLNILHAGVGTVSESDVVLAQASKAIIIGFHVVPDPGVQRMADEFGVDIRLHKIIYNVTDEIRRALEGLLEPTEKIEFRGRAEVREVFNISRVGKVAGCLVREGVIARSHSVRVIRDGVPVKENAALASLKRFKDDAREVRAGLECGIRIDGFDDVKPGDVIEAYEIIKVARTL